MFSLMMRLFNANSTTVKSSSANEMYVRCGRFSEDLESLIRIVKKITSPAANAVQRIAKKISDCDK